MRNKSSIKPFLIPISSTIIDEESKAVAEVLQPSHEELAITVQGTKKPYYCHYSSCTDRVFRDLHNLKTHSKVHEKQQKSHS